MCENWTDFDFEHRHTPDIGHQRYYHYNTHIESVTTKLPLENTFTLEQCDFLLQGLFKIKKHKRIGQKAVYSIGNSSFFYSESVTSKIPLENTFTLEQCGCLLQGLLQNKKPRRIGQKAVNSIGDTSFLYIVTVIV